MTTVVFEGIRWQEVVNNKGRTTGAEISPTELRIIYTGNDGTFRYTNTPDPDPNESLPISDLDGGDKFVATIGGTDYTDGLIEREQAAGFLGGDAGEDDFIESLGQVRWKVGNQSGTTQILAINWDAPESVVATDYIFFVGGDKLPDSVLTDDGWYEFADGDDQIIDAGPISGAFGPNRTIDWGDFGLATELKGQKFVGSSEYDCIRGTDRADNFRGLGGDDYFDSSKGNDTFNGGAGDFDQVSYRGDPGAVNINLANNTGTDGYGNKDKLFSIEMLRGSLFDDTLTGGKKDEYFRGLEGDDTINGGAGNDRVGYDRDYRYEGGDNGVTVNLGKGQATDGFGDKDTLNSIESARGSKFADTLIGSSKGNTLDGREGNDTLRGLKGADNLFGGDGKDRLEGGAGNDFLEGGKGADVFIYKGKFGDDRIQDFSTKGNQEKINLKAVKAITGFTDLKNNHLGESDDGWALITSGPNSIELVGIEMGDLKANDFIF
ncbi:MAG: hypothetical protein HRU31_10010 [Rhodobacteraceae bacterium]|nr:hypothetical protein [Paracoccaceae bacterium]